MKSTRIVRRYAEETLHNSELHPLLKRLFSQRHIQSEQELDHGLKSLLPMDGMKGLGEAVELLAEHIRNGGKIVIIGDYDADGATSTAVAVRGFRLLGAANVDYLVPNRFDFGYGLSPQIVDVAYQHYQPDLIITVDNGIANVDGVARAAEHGIKVVITDHHLAPAILPEAAAIVNPNQPGDQFPSKMLAGVGVIFYVLLATRTHLRETGWFEQQSMQEPNLAQLLDLVALGTVADVVPLDQNNRILVAQGLARIRSGHGCAGIEALCNVAGRDPRRLVSSDLGFAIAPRINAAGRLEDMSLGIECLLSDDPSRALLLASQLDEMNLARRAIETDMKSQAMAMLEQMHLEEQNLPAGICLYEAEWHEGVIGILASRVKDRLHRPVIAFAQSQEGLLKGSARSVKGLHIRDALEAVSARHPGLIIKFGGHAMAAGLTMHTEGYEVFSDAFNREVSTHLAEEDLCGIIHSDGELEVQHMNLEVAELIRYAAPWGQQFPEPIFDGEFLLLSRRVVGQHHLKMTLRNAAGETVDAIYFNATDEEWPEEVERVRLAYRLDVNEFNGVRRLQFLVDFAEPL